MTHDDAEKKICPFINAPDMSVYCQTDKCMMWIDWGERSGDGKKTGHCGLACSDSMK